MKRIGLLLLIGCCSLQAMKKLASVAQFLKPKTCVVNTHVASIRVVRSYSIYAKYNGCSYKDVESVLEEYAKGGKSFIDSLYDTFAHVNAVNRLVREELQRCRDYGSAPDKALFEILNLMAIRQRDKYLKEVDLEAYDTGEKSISDY